MLFRFLFKKECFMKKYFDYLEQLRQFGVTNMFGAVPYLQKEFPELYFERSKAAQVLPAWMDSHREDGGDKC